MARNSGNSFRLARLLDLREQQVAVCRDRVEQCRAELQRWETYRSEVASRRDASALAPGGGVDGGAMDLHLREQGRRWFQQELARVAAESEQWRRALEAAQEDLWQAEQRRQRIDHLRERFEDQQRREAKRIQRRRMNRWGQNGQGGRP